MPKTTRELAWEEFEQTLRTSVSYRHARWAVNLSFDALPPAVVHMAKRTLLDTFAAAMGAFPAEGRIALEKMAAELGGPDQATVIGSGMRTSASNAMIVNCFLVRLLDFNDLRGGGHNSDSISPLLAVAEAEGKGGQDLIVSLVISYELGARYEHAAAIPAGASPADIAWSGDGRGGYTMPNAIGKLMGLDEDQIANATGISGLHANPLKIGDADYEELTNVRNLRFGLPAHDAYLACVMAKHGLRGIIRIIEGQGGVRDSLLHGHLDLNKLTDFTHWTILETPGTGNKTVCQDGTSHGAILSTLQIVREHDIKPEDVEAVKLIVSPRTARHVTMSPFKKYPRTIESSTHSAYFANAIAIKERDCGPEQMQPHKFSDPVVLDLIDRITVVADASLTRWAGSTEIRTKDGRTFQARVDLPHGYVDDMLSDVEIEDKFRDAARPYLSRDRIESVIGACWGLDKVAHMTDVMKLLVVDR